MDKNKYIKTEMVGRREDGDFTGRQKETEWEMCN